MSTDLVTVTPTSEAARALNTLQREGIGRILVTDGDGSLLGLVSRTDLMTVFEITQTSQARSVTPRSADD
jgi:predicted transcriptional regulator